MDCPRSAEDGGRAAWSAGERGSGRIFSRALSTGGFSRGGDRRYRRAAAPWAALQRFHPPPARGRGTWCRSLRAPPCWITLFGLMARRTACRGPGSGLAMTTLGQPAALWLEVERVGQAAKEVVVEGGAVRGRNARTVERPSGPSASSLPRPILPTEQPNCRTAEPPNALQGITFACGPPRSAVSACGGLS